MLLITLIITTLTHALHNEYELSRGRKMWMGMQRAVHYFDHFTLLTTRMNNIKGQMTSNYPFLYKDEWTLSFELKKMGQSLSEKDGFMLLLSPQNTDVFEVDEDDKSNKSFLRSVVS